jgi:polysaccharide export outer membrane protein
MQTKLRKFWLTMKSIGIFGALATCVYAFALISVPVYGADSPGADYRVGAGDLLKVSVFGYPDLNGDLRVSQTGNITFPLLGEVPVAGLSVHEAESLLSRRLADGQFIRNSQVTLLVSEYQSKRVAVLGEVTRPGQYPLTFAKRVVDLIADAGGVLSATAADDATLIHVDGTTSTLDVTAILQGNLTQNVLLAPGDTINIPKAPKFYIYGEVQRPGAYRLERNMTVSQAISAGGGLTRRGSERSAIIKRRIAGSKEQRIRVKGPDLLKPDDVLDIKESWF